MVALIYSTELNPKLTSWCAQRIPHVGVDGFGPCQAIGVASGPDPDDEFYGVFIFHDWQPEARTIQMSAASRSPKLVWGFKPLLRYVFNQLHAYKIWTATPHDNARALKWNRGVGMKQEAVLRHQYGPGRHAVISSMIEPEYRASRWCDLVKRAA